jgi:hypothetical protein
MSDPNVPARAQKGAGATAIFAEIKTHARTEIQKQL